MRAGALFLTIETLVQGLGCEHVGDVLTPSAQLAFLFVGKPFLRNLPEKAQLIGELELAITGNSEDILLSHRADEHEAEIVQYFRKTLCLHGTLL